MTLKSQPLLSICIPTYNRATYLAECIECIVSQEGFDPNIVEIVISDNASPDNTTEVVKGCQENYQNIHYFRNESNIGANLNLFRVAECSSGEYIWFMGDDDTINNGGLLRILSLLKICDNVTLLHANMISGSNEDHIVHNGIDYWKGLVTNNQAHKLSLFLLFLSLVIVRRDTFIDNLQQFREQFPNKLTEAFSHFYVLIRCINNKPIVLLGNIVSGGDGETSDTSYFKNSSKNWFDLVVVKGIDKMYEDLPFLSSIGIQKNILDRYRKNFIKIYHYSKLGDWLKLIGLYRPMIFLFRKLFISKM